jgi:hypothetical protein
MSPHRHCHGFHTVAFPALQLGPTEFLIMRLMDFHSIEEIELAEKVHAVYPTARCVNVLDDERHRYRVEADGKQWPLAADPIGAWSAVLRDIAHSLQKLQTHAKAR